jgi:hypothetical protein
MRQHYLRFWLGVYSACAAIGLVAFVTNVPPSAAHSSGAVTVSIIITSVFLLVSAVLAFLFGAVIKWVL